MEEPLVAEDSVEEPVVAEDSVEEVVGDSEEAVAVARVVAAAEGLPVAGVVVEVAEAVLALKSSLSPTFVSLAFSS